MSTNGLLKLDLGDTDAGVSTLGAYLIEMIPVAMEEKRPFGNSDWYQRELIEPMVRAGLIPGKLDEDGCVAEYDQEAAVGVIGKALKELREMVR